MNPFRPPFGVPSRLGNPNTTQPQQNFNLQDMDPNMLSCAAYLSGSTPYTPHTVLPNPAPRNHPNNNPNPNTDFRSSSFFLSLFLILFLFFF
ncbi:hypothetical protein HanXRQr2_Chr16g0769771 [Helianthus annuus]|uniref:Uncharacterized protein n=1 Tax=Helianthus annuus TaxID=4232 RepID=A0A9K3DVK5_HELAN|nr:hypothetical protein HanXRQr2_Chr16g0769771 [Helianthus annuus]KAJ0822936.1 hypothetical protein HanPSC8_Chr16g0737841 [Helianthus annuus]